MMSLSRLKPSRFLVLLIILFITLLLIVRPVGPELSLKMKVVSAFKPVLYSTEKATDAVGNFLTGRLPSRGLVEENSRLKDKIAELESRLARTQDKLTISREQFKSIKTFLRNHEDLSIHGVVARIIGLEASNWRMSILVDKGPSAGVQKMQPVVWYDAAVGIVGETADGPFGGVSRVKLLSDPACKVWVRSLRSRGEGILVGTGGGLCAMEKTAPAADIREGDIIVTTGKAGIFPESMLVGMVVKRSVKGNSVRYIVKPRLAAEEFQNVLIIQRVSARLKR